jgi:hypothetical protein
VRQLPVKLASAERDRLLREHIDLELEIERLVAKRTELNAEIRPKAKRSAEIVHKLDDDTEPRDVRCTVHELDSNEIVITRDDTGEEIERRTMTPAERQGQWDWAGATQQRVDEAKADAAAKADDNAGEVDQDDDEGAPLAGDESEPAPAAPPRAKRSSKGKPQKRSKGGRRSAAAHAR